MDQINRHLNLNSNYSSAVNPQKFESIQSTQYPQSSNETFNISNQRIPQTRIIRANNTQLINHNKQYQYDQIQNIYKPTHIKNPSISNINYNNGGSLNQMINKSTIDRADIESENKSLRAQLYEVEGEVQFLRMDNDRLVRIVEDYQQEIDFLSPRYNDLELKLNDLIKENNNLIKLVNDSKIDAETWKNKFSARENEVLNCQELQNQLKILLKENDKLSLALQEAIQNSEIWQQKHYQLENFIKMLKEEQANKQAIEVQYSNLQDQYTQRINENDILKAKIQQMEQIILEKNQQDIKLKDYKIKEAEYLINQQELTALRQAVIQKDVEIQTMSTKIKLLEPDIQTLRQTLIKNQDLSNKVTIYDSENQKLTQNYNLLKKEYDLLRDRYSMLEGEANEKIILEKDSAKQRNQVAELQGQLQRVASEAQKLSYIRRDLIYEVDQLRAANLQLEREIKLQSDDFQSQIELIKRNKLDSEIYELMMLHQNEKIQLERVLADTNHNVQNLQEKLNAQQNENQQLNQILSEMKNEIDSLRNRLFQNDRVAQDAENKTRSLNTDIDRLQLIAADRAQEIEHWRKKCVDVENDNANNRSKLVEVENKIAMLISENDRLNTVLKDLIEENEIWSSKFAENERSHYQYIEDLQKKHQSDLRVIVERENKEIGRRLQVDMQNNEDQLKQSKEYAAQLEKRVIMLTNEIETLSQLGVRSTNENDLLRTQLHNLERSVKSLNDIIKDLEIRLNLARSDNDKLQSTIHNKNQEIEDLRIQLNHYNNSLNYNSKIHEQRILQTKNDFNITSKSTSNFSTSASPSFSLKKGTHSVYTTKKYI